MLIKDRIKGRTIKNDESSWWKDHISLLWGNFEKFYSLIEWFWRGRGCFVEEKGEIS